MTTFTVYLGADHAGFALKEQIKQLLLEEGHELYDLSPKFQDGDDYPRVARAVATHVAKDPHSRGVVCCGSGVGVAIGANRVKGVRALVASDISTIQLAREHNDVNILALSGWNQDLAHATPLLHVFFATKASNAARHVRRVAQLG